MRKAKITADVAVMEVPQSNLGVRTRAKTLALQRLQSTTPLPASDSVSDSSGYLQLRSRRLEKPSLLKPQTQRQTEAEMNTKSRSGSRLGVNDSVISGSARSGSIARSKGDDNCFENRVADETGQGSFGEDNSDFQARERSTRESTPCSLIREVDVATPGSSTRRRALDARNQRSRDAILRNIPSAYEMEEFFARAEQEQQQRFIEKYNFDIVADMPLPGRYEWVRV